MKKKYLCSLLLFIGLLLVLALFIGCKQKQEKNIFDPKQVKVQYATPPQEVLITTFTPAKIMISGFDEKLYIAKIITTTIKDDKIEVKVNFQNKHTNYLTTHTFYIKDFLTTSKITTTLTTLINSLTISYPNLNLTMIDNFEPQKVAFSLTPSNYEIVIKKYQKTPDNTIILQVALSSKLDSSIIITKEFSLSGFKIPSAQEQLDIIARDIKVTPLKNGLITPYSALVVNDFTFSPVASNLQIINPSISLNYEKIIEFSFQVEDKKTRLTSKKIIRQYKFLDYYQQDIIPSFNALSFNPANLAFNKVNPDNLKNSFTNIKHPYKLVIEKYSLGLFSVGFTYYLTLSEANLKSEKKTIITSDITLPQELVGATYENIIISNANFLITKFHLNKAHLMAWQAVGLLSSFTHNGKNFTLTPTYYNDQEGQISFSVTNNENTIQETLTVNGFTYLKEAQFNTDIIVGLTLKDNDYLFNNFIPYNKWIARNPSEGMPFCHYFNFPQTITTHDNNSLNLSTYQANYEITKIKPVASNRLILNYQIKIPLHHYDMLNGINIRTEEIICRRINRDQITFPSRRTILTYLGTKITFDPNNLIHFPSYYLRRFKIDASLINILFHYNEAMMTQDVKKYFQASDYLIIKVTTCRANDLTGELLLNFTFNLANKEGVWQATSDIISKKITTLPKMNEQIKDYFGVKAGVLLTQPVNQKKAFANIIRRYQNEGDTNFVIYDEPNLVNFAVVAVKENLRAWDEENNNFLFDDPFSALITRGKLILTYKQAPLSYEGKDGLTLDNKYHFLFSQVTINLTSVAINKLGDNYQISLNYQIKLFCFSATNINSSSITALALTNTITLDIPASIFN